MPRSLRDKGTDDQLSSQVFTRRRRRSVSSPSGTSVGGRQSSLRRKMDSVRLYYAHHARRRRGSPHALPRGVKNGRSGCCCQMLFVEEIFPPKNSEIRVVKRTKYRKGYYAQFRPSFFMTGTTAAEAVCSSMSHRSQRFWKMTCNRQ